MKEKSGASALTCVGAVIGAGFASGREVVVFFTRYGVHSWWLAALAVGVMTTLCFLCLNRASRCGAAEEWCAMLPGRARAARGCMMLVLAVTGGAMTAAAGQMVALLWASDWAYSVGVAATLMAAWFLGGGNLRALGWISGGLTALLLAVLAAAMTLPLPPQAVQWTRGPAPSALVGAGLGAAAYAAMNLALALGVVCRLAGDERQNRGLSVRFGLWLLLLLGGCNGLYLRHPEQWNAAFPIVSLLRGLGRRGYEISAILLYLSILTTLTAVLCTLRGTLESRVRSPALRAALALGLPLAISQAGFPGIVERLYAPAGLLCLALVFAPLACRRKEDGLDKTPGNTVG